MSDLYEELGLSKDATPEQIRKAYKKKALQTHPDRLPPTATSADKSASEEKFRKVNNAYEVLSDPKKRNEYDIHGIWPPPEAEPIPTPDMRNSNQHRSPSRHYYQSRSHTYPDPYSFHRHTPFSAFEFTDPFTLFDSIFEDHNPFRRHRQSPFSVDPFERINRLQTEMDAFMDRDSFNRDPFAMGGFPIFGGFMPPIPSFPAIDRSPIDNSRGRWVSESYMTSTVNGVTQTIRKRVDHNGNEHVTRTLPDGREIRTINGIEQPASGRISYHDPSKDERLHESSNSRYLPPVATHSLPQPLPNTSRTDYSAGRSPSPYTPRSTEYRSQPLVHSPPMSSTSQTNKRSRRSSEKYYPTGDTYNPHTQTDTHHREVHQTSSRKKKWWQ